MTTPQTAQPSSSALTPAGGSVRGRFVWNELTTSDPAGALAFYKEVAGWDSLAFDGMDPPYTMFMRGEVPVGGLMGLTDEMKAGGVPPNWMPYMGVDDIDGAIDLATSLGATVMLPATDVPSVGRVAVLADPQGGAFGLYRPEGEAMPEADPAVGEFSWADLAADDHRAAFDFYEKLFGWRVAEDNAMGPGFVYRVIARGDRRIGGMFTKDANMQGMPTFWSCYLRVADVDAACETVRRLGGKVVMEPHDVPGARIANVADAQGAHFALHQLTG